MKKLFSSPIILALMFISNINAQISFSNPELLSNISSNASFIIDLDGDSDSDILFSSFSDEALYWLENDGQRNFTQNQIATPSLNIASIYANDIEGDGDVDIILACRDDDLIILLENDGSQNFFQVNVGSPNGPTFVTMSDLNQDGHLDIICTSLYDNSLQWYQNSGSNDFTHNLISSSAVGPRSLVVHDIENDGDLDILSAGSYDSNNKLAIFFNDGQMNFSELVINSDNASGTEWVSVGDLIPGGSLEIIASSTDNQRVTMYHDDGTLTFSNSVILLDNYHTNFSMPVDIDMDGDLDIYFQGYNSNIEALYGFLEMMDQVIFKKCF